MAHVAYKNRPEWNDVKPVPQDDGATHVVPIAYADYFVDTMNYFRAVLLSSELSERAFQVTEEAIQLNPGNYTAWGFRRKLLQALHKDLNAELAYIQEMGRENPKNYQVWYHRRAVVEMLGDYSGEIQFCNDMLEEDAKNYHCWTHRHWVVRTQGLWDQELAYVDSLLQHDARNNSAWNYRHFLIKSTTGFSDDIVTREIDYAFDWIKRAPGNESPWSYMKGGVMTGRKLVDYPIIKETCLELLEKGIRSPPMLNLLVEIYHAEALAGCSKAKDEAVTWLNYLEKDGDVIRAKYWEYRRATLERLLEVAA